MQTTKNKPPYFQTESKWAKFPEMFHKAIKGSMDKQKEKFENMKEKMKHAASLKKEMAHQLMEHMKSKKPEPEPEVYYPAPSYSAYPAPSVPAYAPVAPSYPTAPLPVPVPVPTPAPYSASATVVLPSPSGYSSAPAPSTQFVGSSGYGK